MNESNTYSSMGSMDFGSMSKQVETANFCPDTPLNQYPMSERYCCELQDSVIPYWHCNVVQILLAVKYSTKDRPTNLPESFSGYV